MKSISAMDLFQIIQRKEGCLLIDVREVFEHYNFNIGGQNIPMSEIFEKIQRLSTCLLYTSPRPRDRTRSPIPSSA